VKEQAAPQSAPDTGYTPLTAEQMPYRGKSDEFKATTELAKSNVDSRLTPKYHAKIIEAQKARRGAMAELAADHEADSDTMASLLDQLHHIRRRAVALNAVEHYARQMSPEAAAALRAKFNTGFINSIWPK
jgi:hypothetical protein